MIENKKDEKKAVKVKDNKNSKCKWAPSFFGLCGIQTGLFPIISWRSLSVITIIAFFAFVRFLRKLKECLIDNVILQLQTLQLQGRNPLL